MDSTFDFSSVWRITALSFRVVSASKFDDLSAFILDDICTSYEISEP